VDRRTFLRRVGLGGAGAAALAAPAGTYALGDHVGSTQLSGNYAETVKAGQRRGSVNVWWSVTATDKVLALTFDDGPTTQFTAEVLDTLDTYSVPATFFVIGALVERHPDLVRRTLEAGHEVGNHTFDHYSAAIQSPAEVRTTIERGADAVAELAGDRPRWFRPVKGHVTGSALAAATELGHEIALWSVSRDPGVGTAIDDVEGVRRNFIEGIHDGAIVIFHDGIGRSGFAATGPDEELVRARRAGLDALPAVIERYLADGYRFVTASELIDEHG
jgi:peptidoglycan-N-acetylglucosamine deacetylase